MRKLPSYTFVEILVALTITSIIIMLAINLYFQLTQTNNRIIKDYNNNTELLQLQSALNKDFETYDQIEYSIYELSFLGIKGECEYEFNDIGIVRNFQEKKDTFRLQYSDLEYKLQNGNLGNVTEFSFKVKWHKEILPFTFTKEYSSDNKVNKLVFN